MIKLKQIIPTQVCLSCQGCCRFDKQDSAWSPCLLEEEIQDLLDKEIPSAFISSGRRILPVPNQKKDGFSCPFINLEDNHCKIYDFRPFECQLYPFLINLRGKKVILTVYLNCPYVRDNLKSQEFKEYIEYLTAFLNAPAQIRILKDNPQIIQAYEEVADIVELQF